MKISFDQSELRAYERRQRRKDTVDMLIFVSLLLVMSVIIITTTLHSI